MQNNPGEVGKSNPRPSGKARIEMEINGVVESGFGFVFGFVFL